MGGKRIYKIDGISYAVIEEHSVEVSCVERDRNGTVIIPEVVESEGVVYRVTKIGYSAFSVCDKVTSVILPKSVNVIDEAAFKLCSSLVSVNIPEGVKIIGYEAFWGCEKLKSLFIPDSVVEVKPRSLWFCRSLETLSIPKHLLGEEYPKMFPKRSNNRSVQCRWMDSLKQCLVRLPSGEIEEFDVN